MIYDLISLLKIAGKKKGIMKLISIEWNYCIWYPFNKR